jgi:hypothetical protein
LNNDSLKRNIKATSAATDFEAELEDVSFTDETVDGTCGNGWLRGPEPESRWDTIGNRTDWLQRLGTEQQAKTQLMCKEEAHVILNNKHRKLHP